MRSWCGGFLVCFMSLAGIVRAADPAVTNVRAAQRPGTGLVDVTYDVADADTETLFVSLSVSTNGGAAFFTPASGLSGDVGSVARGTGKTILWNAGDGLPPKLYHNVQAQVTASDVAPPLPDAPAGMVLIPGGTNSGQPPGEKPYSLTVEAFYMDATEVTEARWFEVYAWAITNGYSFYNDCFAKAPNHPVLNAQWYSAVKWCNAHSEKEGRPPVYTVDGAVYRTGQSDDVVQTSASGYRLPTRVEWQYAARGGASSRHFPWGDTITHSQANYYSMDLIEVDISPTRGYHPTYNDGKRPYTSPVGSFTPNGYGLYDMAGNVAEWTFDRVADESRRYFMNGGWDMTASDMFCCSQQYTWAEFNGGSYLGFRTVLR